MYYFSLFKNRLVQLTLRDIFKYSNALVKYPCSKNKFPTA